MGFDAHVSLIASPTDTTRERDAIEHDLKNVDLGKVVIRSNKADQARKIMSYRRYPSPWRHSRLGWIAAHGFTTCLSSNPHCP